MDSNIYENFSNCSSCSNGSRRMTENFYNSLNRHNSVPKSVDGFRMIENFKKHCDEVYNDKYNDVYKPKLNNVGEATSAALEAKKKCMKDHMNDNFEMIENFEDSNNYSTYFIIALIVIFILVLYFIKHSSPKISKGDRIEKIDYNADSY